LEKENAICRKKIVELEERCKHLSTLLETKERKNGKESNSNVDGNAKAGDEGDEELMFGSGGGEEVEYQPMDTSGMVTNESSHNNGDMMVGQGQNVSSNSTFSMDMVGQGGGEGDSVEKFLTPLWTKYRDKARILCKRLKEEGITWDQGGNITSATLTSLQLPEMLQHTFQKIEAHGEQVKKLEQWGNFLRNHGLDKFIINNYLLKCYQWNYIFKVD
jgi:hypothetical protein